MQAGENPITQPPVTQPIETSARPSGGSTRSVVSVVATRPETVVSDIHRAMVLAGLKDHLSPAVETLLKINISWQHMVWNNSITMTL